MATSSFLLPTAAAVLVSGCAAQGDFPSLAPRAVERELSGAPVPPCATDPERAEAPAPAEVIPIADDPQLAVQVAGLLAEARRGERAFTALLPQARRAASRAGSAGSESWIEAQQLLSRLEAARSPTVDALAGLDALAVNRANDGGISITDLDRIFAAAEEVRALADAQRAEMDRLNGSISAR